MGLKRKKYCILNKQYTCEEYEKLREKIVKDMVAREEYGEFFPREMCPYGYNETVAMEYFPIEKEEAVKKGFKWAQDYCN